MEGRRFQIPFIERFRKGPFSWRISVDGRHDYFFFSLGPQFMQFMGYYEMQEGAGKSLGWEAEKDFMS